MKYLIVGDTHATPHNLEEIKALFKFINEKAIENNLDTIILLGDLFDTHQIVNLSVLHTYYDIFKKYHKLDFISLVGNHDRSVHGWNRKEHALLPYKDIDNVMIVDDFYDEGNFNLISYCRTEEEFLKFCKKKTSDTLICHQTFDGARYENGFYAKDGFDLKKVPYKNIISGHIHMEHKFDNVFYTGAPRWINRSDANVEKKIWIWDGKQDFQAIETNSVCQPIYSLDLDESSEAPTLKSGAKYILNITGNKKYIHKMYDKYLGKAEIKTNLIDSKNVSVKESMGINKALEKFINEQYISQYGIPKDLLLKEIFTRLL
jgi:DNA repair exonuclease SbcCD nuclease subunit